jgi:hypothetical protein
MRRLRSDGYTEREIMHWSRKVIATFVPAPKQQNLLQFDATPDQRAVVAVGGQQHVFFLHRTGYPDRDRLLAERNGVSAKPASALQCNSLSVKETQQHHGLIQPDKQLGIGGEGGEGAVYRAVWRKVIPSAHLKARYYGEFFACPFYWPRSHSRSDHASHFSSFGVCAATTQYRGEIVLARA